MLHGRCLTGLYVCLKNTSDLFHNRVIEIATHFLDRSYWKPIVDSCQPNGCCLTCHFIQKPQETTTLPTIKLPLLMQLVYI